MKRDTYTVHQPMAFPPIYLIARFLEVGTLVMLDRDYTKNHGLHTRFKLPSKEGHGMYPVPLKGRSPTTQINHVELADVPRFRTKLGKTLQTLYGKYQHFPDAFDVVMGQDMYMTFSQMNILFLHRLFAYLGVGPTLIIESYMGLFRPDEASQWLSDIGRAINCSEYLCAADAQDKYLDPRPFEKAGIILRGQKYEMPQYHPQATPDTSIIDLLFRLPKEEVLKVLLP